MRDQALRPPCGSFCFAWILLSARTGNAWAAGKLVASSDSGAPWPETAAADRYLETFVATRSGGGSQCQEGQVPRFPVDIPNHRSDIPNSYSEDRTMARSPKSRRREQAAALARTDILEAAARAFARSGYSSTKMSEIAEEAGFTAASLYTYFPSKKAIFRELGQLVLLELAAVLTETPPAGRSLPEELEAQLRNVLEWIERRRHVFKVFFDLQWSGEPDLARSPEEGDTPDGSAVVYEHFRTFFAGFPPGRHPPEHLAMALLGLLDVFFKAWLLRHDEPLAALTPLILDLFLHGALGGDA